MAVKKAFVLNNPKILFSEGWLIMPFMYSCNTKEQQLGRAAGAKPLQLFLFHLINGLAQRIPART